MQLIGRLLLTGIVFAAVAVSPARAQQPSMPVIGLLSVSPTEPDLPQIAGFRKGIAEAGLLEGKTVAIDYRSAYSDLSRLPALARQLAGRQVAVMATTGGPAAALAARAASSTLPIVFQIGGDPVEQGLVASLARPGGNLTGIARMSVALEPKRLELLHELLPKAGKIAFLVNPSNPMAAAQLREIEAPARALGVSVLPLQASRGNELDQAFASMAREGATAMLVANDPFFESRRVHITMLGDIYSVPIVATSRAMVAAGSLMSYGADLADTYRQVGVYAGRIVRGERPADLPVLQATRFELVINLRTAKALGIDVPPSLRARAGEVIE